MAALGAGRARGIVRALLAAHAVLTVVFLLVPEMLMVAVSFNPTARMVLPTGGLSLRWYRNLLVQGEFLESLWLSMVVATAASVGSLMLGGTAAYGLSRYRPRLGRVFQALFVAPLVIPATALAVAMFLFLHGLGLTRTLAGVIVVHMVVTFPYTFRTLAASLAQISRSLEEAAMSLGANRLTTVRMIMLPLIRPGMLAAAVFSFVTSLEEATLTLLVGGPPDTVTLPVRIFYATEFGLDPTIAAISTVVMGLSVLAIVVIEKAVGVAASYGIR